MVSRSFIVLPLTDSRYKVDDFSYIYYSDIDYYLKHDDYFIIEIYEDELGSKIKYISSSSDII